MKSIFNHISKFSLLLSLTFLVGACDNPEYPAPDTTVNTNAKTNILLVNTAPGATAKTSLDNVVINESLDYAEVNNNGYFQTFGGQRLIEFEIPGNPVANIQVRQAFNINTGYTIFLTDPVTRPAPVPATADRGGVRTLILTDNLTPPAAGKAGLRFINVAPGASSVSYGLYNSLTQQSLFPTSKTFTTKAGTVGTMNNLQNRSFREVSKTLTVSDPTPSTVRETFTEPLTNFTNVDPGTLNLDIRTSATGLPVVLMPNVTLEAGKLYTIYVYGVSGNTTTPLGLGIIRHN